MVKKYLFVLLSLLLTGVAYADEMDLTPTPDIYYGFYQDGTCYVYVTGEGELTVYINGAVVPDFSNPYIIEPALGQYQIYEIMATAKLEGYLESLPASCVVEVPGYLIPMPMPVFEVNETDDAVVVQVIGDGDLYITMDGALVYDNPIVLPKMEYDYSVYITAMALPMGPEYNESDVQTLVVNVPALAVPEQAQCPDVTSSIDNGLLSVFYNTAEPDGVIYYRYCCMMYPSGEQMDWTEWMVYTEPIVMVQPGEYAFEAYVVAPGKDPSWILHYDVELPEPIPDEPDYQVTTPPIITYEAESMSIWHVVGFFVITCEEDSCDIYWRSKVDLNGSEGEMSDWYLYTSPLVFVDDGHYYIEAYAVAPGKLESPHVVYDIWFSQPETPWDFIEDGIFYNITGPGEVGVTRCSDKVIFYGGDVVIPSTVTHDGVTYAVTSIEGAAFDGCHQLESVVIGDNVTIIDELAFSNCYNLTSVTIGSGVRTVGSKAFYGSDALNTVRCIGTVPPVMASDDCFTMETYNNATLLVPRQSVETYQSTDYWYMFASINGWGSTDAGDVNGDNSVNISDVTFLINLLLTNGDLPAAADFNNDGRVTISDVTALINYLLTHSR